MTGRPGTWQAWGMATDPVQDPTASDPAREPGTTWAGNRSLDTRWWWSPTLMIVVGIAVIWYQFGAINGDGAIWMNWVLVAIGGAVGVAGLVSLARAYRAHREAEDTAPPA